MVDYSNRSKKTEQERALHARAASAPVPCDNARPELPDIDLRVQFSIKQLLLLEWIKHETLQEDCLSFDIMKGEGKVGVEGQNYSQNRMLVTGSEERMILRQALPLLHTSSHPQRAQSQPHRWNPSGSGSGAACRSHRAAPRSALQTQTQERA